MIAQYAKFIDCKEFMVLEVGENEKVLPQSGWQMGLSQELKYIGTNVMGLVNKRIQDCETLGLTYNKVNLRAIN